MYTEAKVDVTQEIEQRAHQAAQAGADHCAPCSISFVTSTLASVYNFMGSSLSKDQPKLTDTQSNTPSLFYPFTTSDRVNTAPISALPRQLKMTAKNLDPAGQIARVIEGAEESE